MNKIYKISNTILLLFILLLLIQSFDQSFGWGLNLKHPNIYFFTFGTIDEGWNSTIWNENGVVETIQIILLLFAIFILLSFFFLKKNIFDSQLIKNFIILEIIGLSYFFFEEISWGQHFLNFDTSSIFLDKESFLYNHQGEINLHNTSRLFNEFPRILVIIWCSLSIFLIQILNLNIKSNLKKIVIPSKKLIIISFLILMFVFPDLIVSKLNMIDHHKLHIYENGGFKEFNFSMMLKIILSFNFFRLSELQELLFAYYFVWHSIFLKNLLLKLAESRVTNNNF
tara:strand:+ start:167 stop:1015 length:849 start_codon:yes stop_codon:yes gene_type:complete